MKRKLILALCVALVGYQAKADDLTVSVIETTPGMSTGSVDLTVTGGVAPYTYDWVGPSSFTSTSEDITGLEAGTYTVTVTDNYCGVAVLEVIIGSVGIEDEESSTLSIFPNPTTGIVNIQTSKKVDIELYSLAGKKLQTLKSVDQVDLTDYADGIYMLKLFSAEGIITRKIIKK